jgi:hypothetical protein
MLALTKDLHILISKIIRRSKRLSPVKLTSSPAKVDGQIATTSQTVDDTIYDISYDSDSDTELDLTASSCTSCNRLKKKIKTLQKTISWHKKTKATLQKKIQRLEAENRTLFASQPSVSTAALDEAYIDEDNEQEYLDDDASMDYSSLEESGQSAAEMDEEITKNTVM